MKIYNKRENLDLRRALRARQTVSERFLWSKLRRGGMNVKFRRQFGIGRYIIDFYAPTPKIAIEIDGPVHQNQQGYDIIRQSEIEGLGIRFLRFTDREILGNIGAVLIRIEKAIQSSLS